MTKKEKEKGSVYNRRSFRVSGIPKVNMGIIRNVEGDSEHYQREENENQNRKRKMRRRRGVKGEKL